MKNDVRKTQEELSKTRARAGRLGGLQTLARHGVNHFKQIGARGAVAFWKLYKFVPVGTSQFAIVHRETNEVKAFLNGMPF